jgi:hypothetical protein
LLGELAGWTFHSHPRLLDSTEIEKATAAASTTLAINSGMRVPVSFASLEFLLVGEL